MRHLIRSLALVILLHTGFASSGDAVAEPDFTNPENVFSTFVKRFASGDNAGALDLFAYREHAEKFDFVKMSVRIESINPMYLTMLYDNDDKILAEAQNKAKAAETMSRLALCLLMPDKYTYLLEGRPYSRSDKDEIEQAAKEIVETIDPQRISDITFLDMREYRIKNPRHTENIGKMGNIYGFDDRKDYTVLYSLDEKLYLGGVTMVRYDERWLINDLRTPFLSQHPARIVVPVTREEYDAMETEF